MTHNITICLLSSIFSFFLAIPHVHGMMEQEDFLENLPKNSKICCLTSLAVYGDIHEGSKEARSALDTLGYTCEENHGDPSLALRMELWRHTDERNPIIATRGTTLASENGSMTFKNILADIAIPNYAVKNESFYKDIYEFFKMEMEYCETKSLIKKNEILDILLDHMPSVTTMRNKSALGGSLLGSAGGVAAGMFVSFPVGLVVAGVLTYGAYKVGEYIEEKAIKDLFDSTQTALKNTNKWIESYEAPFKVTGHSLGGFLTNTVAELSLKAPEDAITFNAPGGVERFITTQKKSITGEYASTLGWITNPFATSQETSLHPFRKITKNITRSHGMIGRFGGDDATRTSVLSPDYHDISCPLPAVEYFTKNHGIFHLARDIGALGK
jgi:hypothetical protein